MKRGAGFSIAERAKEKISQLTNEFRARSGKDGGVVAICWIDSKLNNGRIESQPTVGFYDKRSEVEDDISVVDGLEFVFAVSEEDKVHFSGKTLDYENNRFLVR
jgi:hypothetical protein